MHNTHKKKSLKSLEKLGLFTKKLQVELAFQIQWTEDDDVK